MVLMPNSFAGYSTVVSPCSIYLLHQILSFPIIAGPVDATSAARRRLEGFREGLQEHGFTEQDLLVFLCKFSFDDGYRMMNHFLDIYNQEENCAVFASSDIMAWGAVEACKSRGIKRKFTQKNK